MSAALASPPGAAKMWELTATFPRQLRDGQKAVPRHNFAERPGRPIALVGMGGSGIAGELLAQAATPSAESPLLPIRTFGLPHWVGPETPVVLCSYSGNTAETLAAYEEAKRRGSPRAVLAAGGKLLERARADGVLCVQVPPGHPPRSCLGYLLGGLVGLLRHAVPEVDRQLPREAESLEALGPQLSGPNAEEATLAGAWGGLGDLWVYAPESLAAVARRWKTQIEENTKRLAHYDTVPELMHNAIVAWDAVATEPASQRFVVVLSGRSVPEELSRRLDYLVRMLRDKGVRVSEVRSQARSPLGEVLELTWRGDYVSLWAAKNLGIDPLPVPPIERMKAVLEGAAPGKGPRTAPPGGR